MMIHLPFRPGVLAAIGVVAVVTCAAHVPAAQPETTPPAEHQRISFLTPHPPYPLQARAAHIEGRVTVRVTWAAAGNVKEVVVVKSSGSAILDGNSTNYIKKNWRSFTGKEVTHTVTQEYFLH